MINVMIVDDEPLVRSSVRTMQNWKDFDFAMIHEASNGRAALKLLSEYAIDIVLLDMHMPKCDGLQFLRELRSLGRRIRVIVLSSFDDFPLVREAFTLGVEDYLLKADLTPQTVLNALSRAAADIKSETESREPLQQARNQLLLTEQLLRDLILTPPESGVMNILEDLNASPGFPMVICEFRPILPEEFRKKAMIVQDYLGSVLAARSDGKLVPMKKESILWLHYPVLQKNRTETELSEELCNQAAHLTLQAFNVPMDWAVSPVVSRLQEIGDSYRALNSLFQCNSRPVRRAKDYIRKKYSEPNLSLAEVARYAGVSRTHLSTLFARENSEGFGSFLNQVRIDAACRLLADSDMKIYEISEAVGFGSVEHFSRTFKRILGVSPKRYSES
ncbi:response regulator [Marispirochaeta sp.]|uniref:response regulator transcription factor n=1 Tax=Marispirochaeta sp. TaxID=2038653 RepID=UPI0029C785A3|nr:response regulator [Marispirochaeta sp.]